MLMSCSIIHVVNVHIQAGARVHELYVGGAYEEKDIGHRSLVRNMMLVPV